MSFLPPYLLKISITITVVYAIYWLLFRRLTFYTWNRWYLMILSVLSFIIPLADISYLLGNSNTSIAGVYIPSLDQMMESPDSSSYEFFTRSLTWMNGIYFLVATGTFLLLIRLVIQYLSFRKMLRSADVIMEGPVRVYQVHESIVPFSFANSIFINAAQHSEIELREIIRHEFIHVKQRHSIDIMVSEILVMLNWYNPFAWLFRNAVRQNLEFIADEQVIRTGVDRKEYQYLLLKVIGVAPFAIANKFNFNSLKKRIVMMNKNKTARVHLLRFALVIPVVALSLLAFRSQQESLPSMARMVVDTVPAKTVKPDEISSININDKRIEIVLKDGKRELFDVNDPKQKAAFEKKYGKLKPPPVPPAAPAPLAPPVPDAPRGISGKIVMPDDVETIDIQKIDGKNTIRIVKKDGIIDVYNLNNPEEKAAFEEKYGKLSGPTVPVSADAPVAPLPADVASPPVPPVPPIAPVPVDGRNDPFFKKNPNIRSIYIDDSETLFITLKNGQKEKYSLKDAADKKKVISKYGSLPMPPPAPPAVPDISE